MISKYFQKNRKIILISLLAVIMLLTFQNCGNVKVEQLPSLPPPPAPQQKVNFNLCPVANSGITSKLRLMFIVDMSLSNLGSIGSISGAGCTEGSNVYAFTPNTGTDASQDPRRLTAIRDFLSVVGSSGNNELSYSLLGFSNDSFFGAATVGCSNAISPRLSDINVQINGLIAAQRENIGYGTNGNCYPNPPFTMSTTSYNSALKCLDTAVSADMLFSSEQRPFYQIFFITDGKPNESDSTTGSTVAGLCNNNATCIANLQNCINANVISDELCLAEHIYKPKVSDLYQKISAEGNGFNFRPIFYGKPAEQDAAVGVLNELARADGSLTNTKILSSDNTSFATQLIEEFRDALGVQATSNYTFGLPVVVNLNAVARQNKIITDSDADGVSDELEDSLGWNKNNPRSQGILDGLCHNFLNGTNCAPPVNMTCNTKIGLGLNNCDQEVAKRVWGNTNLITGFDSDSDGIVDFIEIIRGTNPMVNDSNIDSDQDGVKNLKEIVDGTDPFSNLNIQGASYTQFIGSPAYFAQSQCAFDGQGQTAQLENIGYKEIAAFNGGTNNEFNHAENENLVLVTFVAEPIGMSVMGNRNLYYVILKLNSEGKYNKIDLKNADLTKVDGAF